MRDYSPWTLKLKSTKTMSVRSEVIHKSGAKAKFMKTRIISLALAFFGFCRGHSQGFVNLNFEYANVSAYGTGSFNASITDLLPGWTAYLNGSQSTQMSFNLFALDATDVTLLGTNANSYQPISGNYSLLLQGGDVPPHGIGATISQTGLVPFSAQSLLFRTQPGTGPLLVSLGGQALAIFPFSTGANYTLYGADISAFAGLIEALTFTAVLGINVTLPNPNNWNLDNIQFSSSPVPEPSAFYLSSLGGLFFAWRRRKI